MNRSQWLYWIALALAALLVTACDNSDDSGNGTTQDASSSGGDGMSSSSGGDGMSSSGGDGTSSGGGTHGLDETPFDPSCQYSGFSTLVEGAVLQSSNQSTPDHFYFVRNDSEAPFDQLEVRTWVSYGFPGPGSYDLSMSPDDNYRDCALCLRAFTNCTGLPEGGDPTGGVCEKVFYANEGAVEIDELGGAPGRQFKGTLKNVIFKEMEQDPADPEAGGLLLKEVSGGERWCIGDLTFDQDIIDPNANACMDETIACVDEVTKDYELQNCATGEMVSITELATASTDFWMVASAGWCSACRARIPQMLDFHSQEKDNGLGFAIVVGEDYSGGPSSVDFCKTYQKDHYPEADLSLFYADPNFETTFQNIWVYPDSQGAFGLPWQAILEGGGSNRVLHVDGATVSLFDDITNEAFRSLMKSGGL